MPKSRVALKRSLRIAVLSRLSRSRLPRRARLCTRRVRAPRAARHDRSTRRCQSVRSRANGLARMLRFALRLWFEILVESPGVGSRARSPARTAADLSVRRCLVLLCALSFRGAEEVPKSRVALKRSFIIPVVKDLNRVPYPPLALPILGPRVEGCRQVHCAPFFKENGHFGTHNPKKFLASRRTSQGPAVRYITLVPLLTKLQKKVRTPTGWP